MTSYSNPLSRIELASINYFSHPIFRRHLPRPCPVSSISTSFSLDVDNSMASPTFAFSLGNVCTWESNVTVSQTIYLCMFFCVDNPAALCTEILSCFFLHGPLFVLTCVNMNSFCASSPTYSKDFHFFWYAINAHGYRSTIFVGIKRRLDFSCQSWTSMMSRAIKSKWLRISWRWECPSQTVVYDGTRLSKHHFPVENT